MFNPVISPHDANTVLISCDMTGSYITHDGGQSWRMFNLRGVVKYFAFDPVDPKTMYAGNQGLWRSTDGGETWKLLYPQPSALKGVKISPDDSKMRAVYGNDVTPQGVLRDSKFTASGDVRALPNALGQYSAAQATTEKKQ